MSDNQVGFRFTKDNKNASEEVKNRAREIADSFVAKTLEKQKEREAAEVARKKAEIEAAREAARVALIKKEADLLVWRKKQRLGFGGMLSIVLVVALAFVACDWTYSLRETTGHQMLTVRAIKAIPGLFKNNAADNTTMPVSEDGK